MIMLLYIPGVFDVTSTLTKQLEFAARVDPESTIEDPPEGALNVPGGTQFVLALLGLAMLSPDCKLSVKLTPSRLRVLFGFVSVIVNFEIPPTKMVDGVKLLRDVGGRGVSIASVSEKGSPTPPLIELAFTVLTFTPATLPTTSTEKVH